MGAPESQSEPCESGGPWGARLIGSTVAPEVSAVPKEEAIRRQVSTRRWISWSETYAPCRRTGAGASGAWKSISPRPSRRSAPGWSRITRLSIFEATAKAMRAGKLALIRPVTTSTEGRWVAMIRWMPVARASWARRVMRALGLVGGQHHQVGQLVDDHHQVGQFLRASSWRCSP